MPSSGLDVEGLGLHVAVWGGGGGCAGSSGPLN